MRPAPHSHCGPPVRTSELYWFTRNSEAADSHASMNGTMKWYDQAPYLKGLGGRIAAESQASDGQQLPDASFSVTWRSACVALRQPTLDFRRDHVDGIPAELYRQLDQRQLTPLMLADLDNVPHLVVDLAAGASGWVFTNQPIDADYLTDLSLVPLSAFELTAEEKASLGIK